MTTFYLYWRHGKKETLKGKDIAAAFNTKYSAGALRALDWYDTKDTHDWDEKKKEWVSKEPVVDLRPCILCDQGIEHTNCDMG